VLGVSDRGWNDFRLNIVQDLCTTQQFLSASSLPAFENITSFDTGNENARGFSYTCKTRFEVSTLVEVYHYLPLVHELELVIEVVVKTPAAAQSQD